MGSHLITHPALVSFITGRIIVSDLQEISQYKKIPNNVIGIFSSRIRSFCNFCAKSHPITTEEAKHLEGYYLETNVFPVIDWMLEKIHQEVKTELYLLSPLISASWILSEDIKNDKSGFFKYEKREPVSSNTNLFFYIGQTSNGRIIQPYIPGFVKYPIRSILGFKFKQTMEISEKQWERSRIVMPINSGNLRVEVR